jgi:hypothetical protein
VLGLVGNVNSNVDIGLRFNFDNLFGAGRGERDDW